MSLKMATEMGWREKPFDPLGTLDSAALDLWPAFPGVAEFIINIFSINLKNVQKIFHALD